MKLSLPLAAMSLAVVGAAPALSQTGYYSAVPRVAPAKASIVTRSTLWKCTNDTCVAPRGGDRDAVLCELIVQRVGALSSFAVGGTAYPDDALAKCNARAK